jgi:hypothetical protein
MKDFFKTSSCGNIPIPRNHLANFDFLSESTFSLSILCLCFGCFSFALLFLHLLAFFIFSSFNPVYHLHMQVSLAKVHAFSSLAWLFSIFSFH